MNEREDIDMTAAEYVLGTLSHAERMAVDARRVGNPTLERAIRDWELKLAPLDRETAEAAPPPGVLVAIRQRLDRMPARDSSVEESSGVASATILRLEQRVTRWRRTAIAASALAASLVLAIGAREILLPPPAQNFVAVFQKDDAQPAFLMSVDLKTREITIRAVTADRQIGKAYQLWILAEPLGPVPRSLGLLEDVAAPTRKSLSNFEPGLLQNAIFGISVEPPGGSPTGRPTGPALHGKLLPATP